MKRKYRWNQRRGENTASKRLTLLESVSKMCKTAVKIVQSRKGGEKKDLTSDHYSLSVLRCLIPPTCTYFIRLMKNMVE